MARKTCTGALAAAAMLAITGAAIAAPGGSMTLLGVVRDFKASHPDFGPGIGSTGHVAGLTANNLNSRGNPTLSGAGKHVDTEWLNIDGNPIMPGSASAAQGISDFDIAGGTVVSNVAFAAQIKVIGSALTAGAYERPVTLQALIGDDTLEPFGSFASPVSGNVNDDQSITGWANEGGNPRSFVVPNVYAAGTPIAVVGKSWNKTGNAPTNDSNWQLFRSADSSTGDSRVIVLRDGDAVPTYAGASNQASAAEYIADYVSNGIVTLGDNQAIFLYELGLNSDYQDLVVLVTLATDASYFDAPAPEPTSPCFTTADAEGALGNDNAAGISSASSFAQWFADVPGANVAKPHAIKLTQDADGYWVFETDDFTPLDRKGFGNEGEAHNRYFTFEIAAEFTYEACAGQMLEFEGADDAWVFINGAKVLDLGGTNAGTAQVVEVDRAGLTDGELSTMKFFFAHRASDSVPFRIRTNIPLKTKGKVTTATGGLYD
ncbi:MAG: fibro-slime domain-containing protein [Phycisphaerales bacterium]|nr:fibro-slime domain-containing protein [Phycisphaerales bacterium]